MEISSPATVKKDMILKFSRYERAGVKEYWIVSPENKTFMVFKIELPPTAMADPIFIPTKIP